MTDRPISFIEAMILALQANRKFQTRRMLKLRGYPDFFQFGRSDTLGHDWQFRRKDHVWEDFEHDRLLQLLPHKVGDRLWTREKTRVLSVRDGEIKIRYEADGHEPDIWLPYPDRLKGTPIVGRCLSYGGYRETSRYTLPITDVRVQTLQDISEADAIAEGATGRAAIDSYGRRYTGWHMDWPDTASTEREVHRHCLGAARHAFGSLWNSINGRDAWAANGWVTATSFTVHHCNIDQMEAA